jgi:hypothetical protein
METEYTLWLWQCLTNDLIHQNIDTGVLCGIIKINCDINRYSSKEHLDERKSVNGSNRGG